MNAVRMHVVVPENRELKITLPPEVPPGETEIIVLVEGRAHVTSNSYALLDLVDAWRAVHPERRSKEEIDGDLEAERASWERP